LIAIVLDFLATVGLFVIIIFFDAKECRWRRKPEECIAIFSAFRIISVVLLIFADIIQVFETLDDFTVYFSYYIYFSLMIALLQTVLFRPYNLVLLKKITGRK